MGCLLTDRLIIRHSPREYLVGFSCRLPRYPWIHNRKVNVKSNDDSQSRGKGKEGKGRGGEGKRGMMEEIEIWK